MCIVVANCVGCLCCLINSIEIYSMMNASNYKTQINNEIVEETIPKMQCTSSKKGIAKMLTCLRMHLKVSKRIGLLFFALYLQFIWCLFLFLLSCVYCVWETLFQFLRDDCSLLSRFWEILMIKCTFIHESR